MTYQSTDLRREFPLEMTKQYRRFYETVKNLFIRYTRFIYFYWIRRFRNENILDSDEFNNKETLLLRKVEKNMAGNFRCRAVNQFGAEFSESATLTVLGKCALHLDYCYN